MANDFCEILIDVVIEEKPLQRAPAALQPSAGAVVEFLGVVRGREGGESITGIFYQAHREMALHQLRKIAEEARERFGIEELALHHRIGFVPVAEPSLFVRVMAMHRGPAFEACEWIIERLKQVVPIWKQPRAARESAGVPA
jgi:molybdopterin synthase catalytic subunit